MARQDDGGLEVHGARGGLVEVVNFKPEENTVSRREVGIADGTVMMLGLPMVQLKDESVARDEPFIVRAAMRTLATKQTLIPTTAGLNVTHANKGLWTHRKVVA